MKNNIRLVPAQFKHINWIANRMREVDRRECEAFYSSGKEALRTSLARSVNAWTALLDGRPEAMFGVVVESLIGGEAVPWFLGTDEVYRHPRELIMWGPGIIERMANSSLTLSNLVSSDNTRAIRMLEKWGFEIDEREQEIGGVLFRVFKKEPEQCVHRLSSLPLEHSSQPLEA